MGTVTHNLAMGNSDDMTNEHIFPKLSKPYHTKNFEELNV